MPSQIQRNSHKTKALKRRHALETKLGKYSSIYRISSFFYKIFYSLTGFLHVAPDFYIIGAAKCGTSALYDYLIQHPSIYTAVTKEPRYFDKYYHKGNNWYKILFPLKIQKFFVTKILKKKFLSGEATPRYLDHPHVPNRIKKLTPNAKFIVMLRNPVNRVYSHYNMRLNSNKETLSLKDAIELENERTKGEFEKMLNDENYYSRDYYHHSYLDRSIYVDKLIRWMKIFPKENFLIIQSEKFFSNPELVYKDVLKFLDVDEFNLNNYPTIDAGKYKESKMDPVIEEKLIEYFKPHNERLFSFIQTRFNWD